MLQHYSSTIAVPHWWVEFHLCERQGGGDAALVDFAPFGLWATPSAAAAFRRGSDQLVIAIKPNASSAGIVRLNR